MNAEAAGEHTVKYEDSVLRDELVSMLRGTQSRPLYVFLKRLNVDSLYICFCHFSFCFLMSVRLLENLLPKYIRGTSGPNAKVAHRLKVGELSTLNICIFGISSDYCLLAINCFIVFLSCFG